MVGLRVGQIRGVLVLAKFVSTHVHLTTELPWKPASHLLVAKQPKFAEMTSPQGDIDRIPLSSVKRQTRVKMLPSLVLRKWLVINILLSFIDDTVVL